MASKPLLSVKFHNAYPRSDIYVTVSGRDETGRWWLLQSDGVTGYNPPSPPPRGTLEIPVDKCAIRIGPGLDKVVQLPQIDSGRVSVALSPLHFAMVSDPAGNAGLRQPDFTNVHDIDYHTIYGFCEFTYLYNGIPPAGQPRTGYLFANISYVDLVGVPIQSTLISSGHTQQVYGTPANAQNLLSQQLHNFAISNIAPTGQTWPWDSLVLKDTTNNTPLRTVSPYKYITGIDRTAFQGLFEPAVSALWALYTPSPTNPNPVLHVNGLPAPFGSAIGDVTPRGEFHFLAANGATAAFSRPTTNDVFSCSTGPFATPSGNLFKDALVPRFAAALNRGTHMLNPWPAPENMHYRASPASFYSAAVHAVNARDGLGYGFPYDDVPAGGVGGRNVSGVVADGGITGKSLWVIGFGGYAEGLSAARVLRANL